MYEVEELYKLAKFELIRLVGCAEINSDVREDAIHEFVISATVNGKDTKAHQYKCGKNSMIDFLRKEKVRTNKRLNDDIELEDKKQLTPLEIAEAKEEYAARGRL